VTSLVNDIIMPIIGAVTGGLDFSNYYTARSAKVQPKSRVPRSAGVNFSPSP
jgi:large-conductance mechanosensitive channel